MTFGQQVVTPNSSLAVEMGPNLGRGATRDLPVNVPPQKFEGPHKGAFNVSMVNFFPDMRQVTRTDTTSSPRRDSFDCFPHASDETRPSIVVRVSFVSKYSVRNAVIIQPPASALVLSHQDIPTVSATLDHISLSFVSDFLGTTTVCSQGPPAVV